VSTVAVTTLYDQLVLNWKTKVRYWDTQATKETGGQADGQADRQTDW
jgi:hypothetical protein